MPPKKTSAARKGRSAEPPGLAPTYASGRRIARLTAALLTQPAGASVESLADQLGVSQKSFERYLNAIAEEFPGQIDREGTGAQRRIRFRREDGSVSQLGLFPFAAAFFAGQFLNWVQGTRLQDEFAHTLKRLEARLTQKNDLPLNHLANKFTFFPRAPKDLRLHRTALDTIVEALIGEWELDIRYVDAQGKEKRYPAFQPLTLAAYQEALYLIGQKRGGKHRFTLAVDRIRGVERTDDHFSYPDDYDPNRFRRDAFGLFQGTPQAVELRFVPELADWVRSRRWHASQRVAVDPDGSLRLSLRASFDADLVSWILGFGPGVEVLAPDELRARVAAQHRAAIERYPG